jgi:hypothetical protein
LNVKLFYNVFYFDDFEAPPNVIMIRNAPNHDFNVSGTTANPIRLIPATRRAGPINNISGTSRSMRSGILFPFG